MVLEMDLTCFFLENLLKTRGLWAISWKMWYVGWMDMFKSSGRYGMFNFDFDILCFIRMCLKILQLIWTLGLLLYNYSKYIRILHMLLNYQNPCTRVDSSFARSEDRIRLWTPKRWLCQADTWTITDAWICPFLPVFCPELLRARPHVGVIRFRDRRLSALDLTMVSDLALELIFAPRFVWNPRMNFEPTVVEGEFCLVLKSGEVVNVSVEHASASDARYIGTCLSPGNRCWRPG